MSAAIKRTDAANTNVANATSFLQTQDGALQTAGNILDRISELKTLSTDVTKTTTDTANYNKEFTALQSQLTSLSSGKFNGVDLFNHTAGLAVGTSEDGAQTQGVSQSALTTTLAGVVGATDLSSLSLTSGTSMDVAQAITDVAAMRAQNGAESSNLGFASDMLSTNSTNLQAANSRIMDVDVAQESTTMAKNNILVQAGASMLAQANSSSQVALKLLQ
jgi:flagellin